MPVFDERIVPQGVAVPQWFFGVQVNEELFFDPVAGPFQGLRVVFVYFGSPASFRVEPGDIITRVDGQRVQQFSEFYQKVAFSPTGVISLRVRDVRTGAFIDLLNIQLVHPAGPGPGPGPGPIGP